MKKLLLTAACVALTLSGCTHLNDNDRALLTDAQQQAQKAKELAEKAAMEAKMARQDADDANWAAQEASEKADKIFRTGSKK